MRSFLSSKNLTCTNITRGVFDQTNKTLKATVRKAVEALEQQYRKMKEQLFEIKTKVKAKSSEIVVEQEFQYGVVDFWMPNKEWESCHVKAPSARVLSNYGDSGK